MQRICMVTLVVLSGFVVGCGSSSTETHKPPANARAGEAVAPEPELAITKLETPEEQIQYLRQLGQDSQFDPHKHVDMLKKYASDKNEEVAVVARELLDRAK